MSENIIFDGGVGPHPLGVRRVPLSEELSDDTTAYLIVRKYWEAAGRHVPYAQGAINTVYGSHYLVEETEQDEGGYYQRIYAPIPTVDALPQPYSVTTYVVSENSSGTSDRNFVPRGAIQVGQVTIPAAVTRNTYTGGGLGVTATPQIIYSSETVRWNYSDGTPGTLTYNNKEDEPVTITVWAASKGDEAQFQTPIDITAEVRREYFVVGSGQTYSKPTSIPVYSRGNDLGAGFEVLEPSRLSRWRGNIYVRETVCTDRVNVSRKFEYTT